jgi:hypothetical protein
VQEPEDHKAREFIAALLNAMSDRFEDSILDTFNMSELNIFYTSTDEMGAPIYDAFGFAERKWRYQPGREL